MTSHGRVGRDGDVYLVDLMKECFPHEPIQTGTGSSIVRASRIYSAVEQHHNSNYFIIKPRKQVQEQVALVYY